MPATLTLHDISVSRAARRVLDHVDLVVPPGARIGVVGPNGVGKTTLLAVAADAVTPERGTVRLAPPTATVGWLHQEPERTGELVRDLLDRRTGVAAAQAELDAATEALADTAAHPDAADRYDVALQRWLALGAADLHSRVGQVADLEAAVVSSRIQRANRQYAVTVYVTPLGRGSTDVLNDITTLLDDVNFAPGSGYGLGAESQRISEGNSQLIIALATALVLVYILMVGLYESFLQPLAVMSALPVTLVGAVGGLYLTGQSINIISMLGIIMLAGLVTKNAILLVDLANELRKEPGLPIKEALITAGHQRLRAILMTALSLVFALIPLLLNNGLGSELRQPMAAVVIGGTLVSVAFFIFLVPVAYNFFEGVGQALGWLSRRVVGLGDEAGIEAKAET